MILTYEDDAEDMYRGVDAVGCSQNNNFLFIGMGSQVIQWDVVKKEIQHKYNL